MLGAVFGRNLLNLMGGARPSYRSRLCWRRGQVSLAQTAITPYRPLGLLPCEMKDLRYAAESRDGFDAQLSHDAAAMHLDSHFADRELVRDLLVHEAGRDERRHLAFARRKCVVPFFQSGNLRDFLAPASVGLNRSGHCVKQVLIPDRLREEVDRPSLHAPH